MMYTNKFSKKFILKLLNDTFNDITDRHWYRIFYSYVTDSKERTRRRLNLFLKDQIDKPAPELVKLSKKFLKYPNPDERIIEILKFVKTNIKYVSDKRNFGKVEYWASAIETWKRKADDCDGQNSLIYVLARLSGISDMNLWCAIGDTSAGGHFWLVYLSPKYAKWVSIDGTFYPSFKSMKTRPKFIFKNKYRSIWFLFNEQAIFKT